MATPLASLRRSDAGALVLAAAVPLLFLHGHYQPHVGLGRVDVDLSDLAVLAVVVAALLRGRPGALRGARAVWAAWAALLVWIAFATVYGKLLHPAYPFGTHAVSALKFGEYALLAPAVPLLLAGARRPWLPLAAAVAWSVAMSAVGVLQFLGVVAEFEGLRPGQREPSYVGIHEWAAFSGSVLVLALAAIALRLRADRRAAVAAGIAGGLGVAIAAALDSVGALALSAVILWGVGLRRAAIGARRTLAVAGIVVVVGLAAVVLRASTIQAFLRFVGVEQPNRQTTTHVQSYAHRTLLAYVGYRIWLAHPILGVGWQGSFDRYAYRPVLSAAHRRFPAEPEEAFPSPAHPWGVQNAVVQALADLGPVGLVLFLAVFAVPFAAALRVALRGPPGLTAPATLSACWLVFALAVFAGSGLVTGDSPDALLWLAVGSAATVAAAAGSVP